MGILYHYYHQTHKISLLHLMSHLLGRNPYIVCRESSPNRRFLECKVCGVRYDYKYINDRA